MILNIDDNNNREIATGDLVSTRRGSEKYRIVFIDKNDEYGLMSLNGYVTTSGFRTIGDMKHTFSLELIAKSNEIELKLNK